MDEELLLKVEKNKDSLRLKGMVGGKPLVKQSWQAFNVGTSGVLLWSEGGARAGVSEPFFCGSPIQLLDILNGFFERRWTGRLTVRQFHEKRFLYWSNGELVFAESTLVDDRLGEVMFRQGHLTVQEFTKATVLVTAETHFGQILIQEGLASHIQLWHFLQEEIKHIILSIFSSGVCSVHAEEGVKAPQTVILEQETKESLENIFLRSILIHDFFQSVDMNSVISSSVNPSLFSEIRDGTYSSDLLKNIGESTTIKDFVNGLSSSKFVSFASLFSLVEKGYCHVNPSSYKPYDPKNLSKTITEKITLCNETIATINDLYSEKSIKLPLRNILDLTHRLNKDLPFLFIDSQGFLREPTFRTCLSQATFSSARLRIILHALETVMHYSLSMANDRFGESGQD